MPCPRRRRPRAPVAAAAMNAVTAGVAIPSLRPLSTFSERRMERGSDSSDTTLALSAASVGAKTAPSKAASSHGRSVRSIAARPAPSREREGQSDGEQAGRQPSVAAEVLRIDPGGVREQEECEGDFGQSVHRVRLDRDLSHRPGSVAEEHTCGDEHDRTGHIEPFQAARQHRPPEEEEDEGDQSPRAHGRARRGRVGCEVRSWESADAQKRNSQASRAVRSGGRGVTTPDDPGIPAVAVDRQPPRSARPGRRARP